MGTTGTTPHSAQWARFSQAGKTGLGRLLNDRLEVFEGDLFNAPRATGETLSLDAVQLLYPVHSGKVIALYNNFHALLAKNNAATPAEPLYFLKAPSSYANPGDTIRDPACGSRIVFEGELGIVIGQRATRVSPAAALDHVFGYTCANDATAVDLLTRDPAFPQWVRAKGFDTFCPFGPVISTGLDPVSLVVKTTLNGSVRQEYAISDMVFSVAELVSRISHDMTLEPGDMILCGTSVGVGVMKPGSTVEVEINGIGCLQNRFE